jgi:hypothetical protein
MEAMLGISIFIPNWQKWYVFLIIAYVFSSTKSEKRVEQVLPESRGLGGVEGVNVAQTIHTHVSKCKNDKRKGEKNKTTCY